MVNFSFFLSLTSVYLSLIVLVELRSSSSFRSSPLQFWSVLSWPVLFLSSISPFVPVNKGETWITVKQISQFSVLQKLNFWRQILPEKEKSFLGHTLLSDRALSPFGPKPKQHALLWCDVLASCGPTSPSHYCNKHCELHNSSETVRFLHTVVPHKQKKFLKPRQCFTTRDTNKLHETNDGSNSILVVLFPLVKTTTPITRKSCTSWQQIQRSFWTSMWHCFGDVFQHQNYIFQQLWSCLNEVVKMFLEQQETTKFVQ